MPARTGDASNAPATPPTRTYPSRVPDDLLLVVITSGVAAVASVVGGLLALWHRSSTLISSLAFGVAGGALIGTVTLEMLPTALESGGLAIAFIGFTAGMLSLFVLDLVVHGGLIMGEHADQRRIVRRYHRRRRSRSSVLVLAGGTSVEELVEGLVIGVGAAVEPSLAFVAAVAIGIDNLAEGMSVGELIRGEMPDRARAMPRVLAWTGTIGVALFVSSIVGWIAFRGVPPKSSRHSSRPGPGRCSTWRSAASCRRGKRASTRARRRWRAASRSRSSSSCRRSGRDGGTRVDGEACRSSARRLRELVSRGRLELPTN